MKKRTVALLAIVAALFLTMAGCDMITGWITTTVEDYLPLEEGAEWTYDLTVTFYDESGSPDPDTAQTFTATLEVAGTKEIGDITAYEMKVKDFAAPADTLSPEDVAEINAALAGSSIFVAITEEGLELFGIEVSQSSAYNVGGPGYGDSQSFDMSATFSPGIPVLPPFLFVGATHDFQLSVDDEYKDYEDGTLTYERRNTLDIDADIEIVTRGDKRPVMDDEYKGSEITIDATIEDSYYRWWDDSPTEQGSSTVESTGTVFFAKGLGIAFAEVTWDWGTADDNLDMPASVVLQLTGTSSD
jgi:hypothetical protein